MPVRTSLLLQAVSSPTNLVAASPHIAGWSEGFWTNGNVPPIATLRDALANSRATLLPSGISVVGYRTAIYNIQNNRLVPLGTASGKYQLPGTTGLLNDLPQVCLNMNGTSANVANTSKFSLRGMPDFVMVRGEYQPAGNYVARMTAFTDILKNGVWGFIGRNLLNAKQHVIQIVNGIMTVGGLLGAAVGDYVRLLRVKDINGNTIKGTFRISFQNPPLYTLEGFDAAIVVRNSGGARLDQISFLPFNKVVPSRAAVKKVGRPFEQYRGRQSKS